MLRPVADEKEVEILIICDNAEVVATRGLHHAAVQPGQPEQVLCNTAEPFRLLPDVADKFPCGSIVHILILEDRLSLWRTMELEFRTGT